MSPEQLIYVSAMEQLDHDGLENYQRLAPYMVAQSKHESNSYQSKLFKLANNSFGYTYVPHSIWQLKTPYISAESGIAFAKYSSIEDSAREVADWIGRRKKSFIEVTTLEEYSKVLKLFNYYEDSQTNYLNGLKKYYKPIIQMQ